MFFVRDTSGGRLVLGFSQVLRGQGPGVQIARIEQTGWATELGAWSESSERRDQRTFAAVLAEVAGVPGDEAERIAKEAIEEWRARGGAEEGQGRLSFYGMPMLAAAAIILGAALLVVEVL